MRSLSKLIGDAVALAEPLTFELWNRKEERRPSVKWIATAFLVDADVSCDGYGKTPEEAVSDLIKDLKKTAKERALQ